jgi:DNA-binding GntR family transcriptional regulator
MTQSVTEDITLHEGTLAAEFGVSRTPIRQVLQKLAYERLVETRSGVGTIVARLDPEERQLDQNVLEALFRAAADCAGPDDMPDTVFERLQTRYRLVDATGGNAAAYLEHRTDLLEISADITTDAILADAIRAAHWRQIRWRMTEAAWDEPDCLARLHDALKASVACAESGDAAGVLRVLAQAGL